MVITERQEAILSYFIGMSRVQGPEISFRRKHLLDDLGFPSELRAMYHSDLQRLQDVRAIEITALGAPWGVTRLRVMKDIKDFQVKPQYHKTGWWMAA